MSKINKNMVAGGMMAIALSLTSVVSITTTDQALAQTTMPTEHALLTPQIVENFVASFPDVKSLSKTLEAEFDVPRSDSPTENLGAFMQYQGAMARMNDTVGKYGFADFMDWMQTMSSVVTAYTFAREGGGMDQQMAQALAQIDANPNLTEAQKTMMRQQFAKASESMSAIKPSQGNIDAVAGYTDELKVLFEDD